MEKRYFAATGSERRVPIEEVDPRNGKVSLSLNYPSGLHPHFGI